MDDDESFVPCYPAPVNTMRLVQLKALGSTATRVSNVAAWYGVLAAYAKYTAGLLENESDLPPHVVKKLTTVFEMLQSVLQLFADVVSTTCYTSHSQTILLHLCIIAYTCCMRLLTETYTDILTSPPLSLSLSI